MKLTWRYKRGSKLPQRTFVVNVTVNGEPDLFEVTAPDALAAEQLVRQLLNDAPNVEAFRFDLIREVRLDWERKPIVSVPDTFRWAITVG